MVPRRFEWNSHQNLCYCTRRISDEITGMDRSQILLLELGIEALRELVD